MDRVPTVYDVASVAGVSIATVSRYFRQPEKVSETTRQSILAAVTALGYVPSGSARGLAARRTGVLGLCSFGGHEPDELALPVLREGAEVALVREDSQDPRLYPLFADEVLRGVELECTLHRFALMISWGSSEISDVMISDVAGRVDGLVVLPGVVPESVVEHVARTIPVVMISAPPKPGSLISHVTVDNAGGMRALTRHLISDHGLRDLWFYGQPTDLRDDQARFKGFRDALKSAALPVPRKPQLPGFGSRTNARQVVADVLAAARSLPEAIVCCNDQSALGVIDVLRKNGIKVPEQVAVTGFDGIDAGRFLRPSLTTVRQPMDALGRVAVEILLERVGQRHPVPTQRKLPVQVVLRESCGCASL